MTRKMTLNASYYVVQVMYWTVAPSALTLGMSKMETEQWLSRDEVDWAETEKQLRPLFIDQSATIERHSLTRSFPFSTHDWNVALPSTRIIVI